MRKCVQKQTSSLSLPNYWWKGDSMEGKKEQLMTQITPPHLSNMLYVWLSVGLTHWHSLIKKSIYSIVSLHVCIKPNASKANGWHLVAQQDSNFDLTARASKECFDTKNYVWKGSDTWLQNTLINHIFKKKNGILMCYCISFPISLHN